MSLKTDQLRYFVTVAEEGQITRAAKKLYIAQPALSQAIAQLESELGLQLLERHAKGVRLTAAGEAFLEKARAVVETEREVSLTAESLARAARGRARGRLHRAATAARREPAVRRLRVGAPDCEVCFRELPFPRGETRTWIENVDVTLDSAARYGRGIGSFPVRVEPRALMVSADHPLCEPPEVGVEDALEETFISYGPDVQPAVGGLSQPRRPSRRPPAATTSRPRRHIA